MSRKSPNMFSVLVIFHYFFVIIKTSTIHVFAVGCIYFLNLALFLLIIDLIFLLQLFEQ